MKAVIHGIDGGENLEDVCDWIRKSFEPLSDVMRATDLRERQEQQTEERATLVPEESGDRRRSFRLTSGSLKRLGFSASK
jgi:hypothetical protein